MKRVILLAALWCSCAEAALQEIPRQFFVKQHWLSWTTAFDIETTDLKLGTVHRKFLSLSPLRYDFFDVQENLQASASMRWFSWGATFDVTDNYEQLIGTVEQRVFAFFPTFDILSPIGTVLAVAKLNFWGTTYTLSDPATRQNMATFSRPFFRFKDNWTATITDPELFYQKLIDPRLFVLVMAFQTDRDFWAAEARRRQQQSYMFPQACYEEPSQDLMIALRTDLQECRQNLKAAFGDVVSTEADAARMDEEAAKKLNDVDAIFASEGERLAYGFAILKPLLDSDAYTPAEKNALLKLFENRISTGM